MYSYIAVVSPERNVKQATRVEALRRVKLN